MIQNNKEELFIRFNTSQLIQHIVWGLSFTVLALTGLAHKYPDSGFSALVIASFGGYEGRQVAHRIAAFFWVGTGIYHSIYYLFSTKAEREMLWKKKDLEDFKQNWSYLLGKTTAAPRFGRYSWSEKFEYWASWIGGPVMTITGLLMLFAFPVMKVVPLMVIEWARVIHGWEAILAVLVIIEFHLYMNVFRPQVFPMAKHWLTGTLTREEMEEEHPLELEEIMKKRV